MAKYGDGTKYGTFRYGETRSDEAGRGTQELTDAPLWRKPTPSHRIRPPYPKRKPEE